jgi:hypothetical protein
MQSDYRLEGIEELLKEMGIEDGKPGRSAGAPYGAAPAARSARPAPRH